MEPVIEHSVEEHFKRLNSLCRLCGERAKRNVKDKYMNVVPVKNYAGIVFQLFGVAVSEDCAEKHSTSLCKKCQTNIISLTKRAQSHPVTIAIETALVRINAASLIWTDYNSSLSVRQCCSCCHFGKQSRGGRPKIRKGGSWQKLADSVSNNITAFEFEVDAAIPVSYSSRVKLNTAKTTNTLCVSMPAIARHDSVHMTTFPLRGSIRPIQQQTALITVLQTSAGGQGSTATREQHALSHQPHSDVLCDIMAEQATHGTVRHLKAGESVMAEPAAHDVPQNGAIVIIKAEPTDHQTAQHPSCENIKAEPTDHQTAQHPSCEPADHQAAQHPSCENIKAKPTDHQTAQHPSCEPADHQTAQHPSCEPADHQTAQYPSCENIKVEPADHQTAQHPSYEPTDHRTAQHPPCEPADHQTAQHPSCEPAAQGTEDSEEWGEFRGVTVKFEPVECSLQQENQASSPCPVRQEGKDVTDCCEPESASEPASGENQATPLTANNKSEWRRKWSPQHVTPLHFPGNADVWPEVTQDRVHVCQLCSAAFLQCTSLKTHLDVYHNHKLLAQHSQPSPADCGGDRLSAGNSEEKPGPARHHVCDVCSKAFVQARNLKMHKLIHTGDKTFVCDVCSKAFTRASNLRRHQVIHTGVMTHVCDVCNESFKYAKCLNKHKLIHTDKGALVCDVCNKAFDQPFGLKRHKLIHMDEKSFVCDVCNKAFNQAANLKTHKLIHTDAKCFVCDVCSKAFKHSGSLKIHKLIHKAEKPFVCDVCSKGFTVSGHLQRHKLIHTGEKPFVCDVCSKGFIQASSLKTHKLIHSGETPFVCDVCSKGFTSSSDLQKHKLIHTGQKPFECDVCGKRFTRASLLKRHKLTHTS